MKIEAMNGSNTRADIVAPAVETLESRLLQASRDVSGGKRPDPEFDPLYQQLLSMEGQGEKAIYEFIRLLRAADGETPAYPTATQLLAVTLQVLVRLKDEKLQDSLIFKEVKDANGLAFALDICVKNFMREVFENKDDEAWEKAVW